MLESVINNMENVFQMNKRINLNAFLTTASSACVGTIQAVWTPDQTAFSLTSPRGPAPAPPHWEN